MRKALIYPYDIEFAPIARHASLLKDIEIWRLVSPWSWGYAAKDAAFADGGAPMGKLVECDFDAAIEDCDVLLLIDSNNKLEFDSMIFPEIAKTVELGKKVIISRKLSSDEKEKIDNAPFADKLEYVYDSENLEYLKKYCEDEFHQINVPVVFILGNGEQASKFEIQLSLREELIKNEYKLSQVGSRECCEMLGFHSLPHFLFDTTISDDKKIMMYNHYIKLIECEEKPDLILIGIPGGVMPISNQFTNRFGLLAFEISQAVTPDYVIFTSLYEDYREEYFGVINDGVQKRLGYKINCHNISTNMLDWPDSEEMNYLCYLTLDSDFVSRKLSYFKTYNKTVFNIYQDGSAQLLCDEMINGLSECAYVKSI